MRFSWWDDALAQAVALATDTMMPHKIFWDGNHWVVELADRAVLLMEPRP